jgi:hypothetical protein
MKKTALIACLLASLAATGCIKSSVNSTVKNDGTASVKVSFGYSKEVIDSFKSMMEASGAPAEELDDMLGGFEAVFDEKKVAEQWKGAGLEVAKSASTDKDGWKMVEIEGSAKDLAEYGRKYAAELERLKEADESDPMAGLRNAAARLRLPALPRFYKTDKPNVAKVVIAPPELSQREGQPKIEEMSDEELEMLDEQLGQMREMFGLDSMKLSMTVTLPGKILSVENGKKEGDDVLAVVVAGSDLTAESMAALARARGRTTAMLEFDPATFKIPLQDEPKSDSKPAAPKPVESRPRPVGDEDEDR